MIADAIQRVTRLQGRLETATLGWPRSRNRRPLPRHVLDGSKSTVRYLGIEVDDALEIAEQTEV